MSRPSSDKQRASLKLAFARAVDSLGGNKIVEGITRVKSAMISLYIATHEDERHAGLDVAFDLDKAHVNAGSEPPILATYAALLGFSLSNDDAPARGQDALSLADVARVDREAYEARAALYDSLADGKLTPNEKRKALKELGDLRQAIVAIEAKVGAM